MSRERMVTIVAEMVMKLYEIVDPSDRHKRNLLAGAAARLALMAEEVAREDEEGGEE